MSLISKLRPPIYSQMTINKSFYANILPTNDLTEEIMKLSREDQELHARDDQLLGGYSEIIYLLNDNVRH